MQLNYSNQAAEKGVYIIGSCGFDSIPADMGVLYTRDQFKGTHNNLTANCAISALFSWSFMQHFSLLHSMVT